MLTKLRILNLAYAELLRRQDIERNHMESRISQNLIRRYDEEIEELHDLILNEEYDTKFAESNNVK